MVQASQPSNIPKHVAIVMDGNGRWARNRFLPRIAGHRAGAQAVSRAVNFAVRKNIKVLTLFALSVENFINRPKNEVKWLMRIFLESLQKETSSLCENNIRLQIIGDRSVFTESLLAQIEQVERLTMNNTGLTLVVAINYSGRWDIVQAARHLLEQVMAQKLSVDEITTGSFAKQLCLHELPEPDLFIRTSGEQRISNFMLWQFAYTEMFFIDVFWPDFTDQVFESALNFYHSRQRRFGHTSEQIRSQYA